MRSNAFFFRILLLAEDIGVHALIGCRDKCRDQLRWQEDQEAQRARENILSLLNNINMMGCWVREGWLLDGRN